jgi:ketol-acid reductoisomerase
MSRVFLPDDDIDPGALDGALISVIGFGNQGHAHALNLRDSGASVVVGARPRGDGFASAAAAGFETLPIPEAAAVADVAMLTLPDQALGGIYAADIGPHLRPGSLLLFAHGFAVRYRTVVPGADLDVGLVAPKGPGRSLRAEYEAGGGLAALVAIGQDSTGHARQRTLAYAALIGCARTGLIETTIAEETETDLFGEQTVLCGGIPGLLKAAFETLVDAGYRPEVAYFECVHEAKLIVDLIAERGMAGMRAAISETAAYGGFQAEAEIVGPPTRARMEQLLAAIRSGDFAREWMEQSEKGAPDLRRSQAEEAKHPIEGVGETVRARIQSSKRRG